MTKILAICGKKKSGKDTCANFLARNATELLAEPNKSVKIYHWGDALKEFLIEYLDIPRNLLYGTDDDKNKLTHIRWEDMPHYEEILTTRYKNQLAMLGGYQLAEIEDCTQFKDKIVQQLDGYMTVREILQHVGTEVMRRMNNKVWVNKLVTQIKRDNYDYALIADTRFPIEVEKIITLGAKTLRLTRHNNSGDTHISETALDNYEKFDYIIDNLNQSVVETYENLKDMIKIFGWDR